MASRSARYVILLLLAVPTAAVDAQDDLSADDEPAVEEPVPVGTDAFRDSLRQISAESGRRADIEEARRIADFDLDWALECSGSSA